MTRGVAPALLLAVLAPVACATSGAAPGAEPEATAALTLEDAENDIERAYLRGLVALKLGGYQIARRELARVAEACPTSPIGGHALVALAAAELDPRNDDRDPRIAREAAERLFLLPEKPAWVEPAAETLYLLALELGAGMDAADGPSGNGDTPAAAADSSRQGAGDPAERAGDRADASGATDAEALEPAARRAREGREAAEWMTPHTPWQAAADRPLADSAEEDPAIRQACEAARERTIGTLQPPVLPGEPLAHRLQAVQAERDSLRDGLSRSARQVAELRQELERIREALRP